MRKYVLKITDKNIDGGKPFDWGRTALDYAKFRDIYPEEFYKKILCRNLCVKGQTALDVGTGTGVLPRNMCQYGAAWTAVDRSEEQIEQARFLSKDMPIDYYAVSVENMEFEAHSFDVITACQCFWYFDHEKAMLKFSHILKSGGSLLLLYMAWLPYEDKIAGASESLVLKYSPEWSGAGETMHSIFVPDCYNEQFDLVFQEEYPIRVPFTRELWNGRIKTCRGIGASLTEKEVEAWEQEHLKLLREIAPDKFEILHYGAIAELKKKT